MAASALRLVPQVVAPEQTVPEELTDQLRLAALGDLDAAAAVFEATVHDAWRIALLTAGSPDRAAPVVEAAYQRIWAEAGGDGAAVSRDVVPAPLSRAWVLGVVHRVARESAALASSA